MHEHAAINKGDEANGSRIQGDILPCGVHVADIIALMLDFEEQDQLVSIGDVATMFRIEPADVAAALSHYSENLERLRPAAHARRRVHARSAPSV